jgi:hypothetical protein
MNATRDRAQIAIHYSQPSIQAAWMIDSRPDGDTWVRRFSSYESVHSGIARVRGGWMKLVEDLGLQYDFVSAEQIETGRLGELGYKVLVLPESLAMSDEEAAQIRAFVRGGGTVIADFLPGVFDEHAKRRKTGVLDGFFGVSRPGERMTETPEKSEGLGFALNGRRITVGPAESGLRLVVGKSAATVDAPTKAASMVGNVPVIIGRNAEKGRAVYLNISPIDYPKDRLVGKGGDLRGIIGDVLRGSGVAPAVTVTGELGAPVGCEVVTYTGEGCRYVAIMRNPEYAVSDLGEIGFTDNSRFERPERLAIELGQPAEVKELHSGREFGTTSRVELTLDPWKPVVLEVR